ncbi:putative siroheme synthase [Rosellinia necatrix]|uniref:Putative siroheme synthase n=1 Tax=Rosellinia necatrix TaxID=77044 RepID=A0A1W2TFV7_ROSNE|nr:putative siroheme synthase [Rosellinia necatrix]
MPPKKRGRPAAAAAQATQPESEPELAGSDDNQTDQEQDLEADRGSGTASEEPESRGFKFFNTTFSTFRVSPLYIAQNALSPAGLEALSRRLRDTLVGDVVRGVQVGLEGDTVLGRLGTLERVEWRACSLGAILPSVAQGSSGGRRRERQKGGGGGPVSPPHGHLLCLELAYENASFSALLLPSLDDQGEGGNAGRDGGDDGPRWIYRAAAGGKSKNRPGDEETTDDDAAFARFPLLLTRMPVALKVVLLDFLTTTFDCRISPLRLGTRTLVRGWERWMEDSGVGAGRVLNRDVALTLGFHLEPPPAGKPADDGENGNDERPQNGPTLVPLGLKTIDVMVPASEVRRFLRVGKRRRSGPNNPRDEKRPAAAADAREERRRRRKLGGGRDEEGWAWRDETHPSDDDDNNNGEEEEEGYAAMEETFAQPFTDALARYLAHHLALDVLHPGVRVQRVVCDAFALSDGRVKVFSPPRGDAASAGSYSHSAAVESFVRDLVRRAQGRAWGPSALRLAALEVLA